MASDVLAQILAPITKGAKALQTAAVILKDCRTPEEVRTGLCKAAEVISNQIPAEEDTARKMRDAARPGALDDEQVVQMGRSLALDFAQQSSRLFETARELTQKFGSL